MIRIGRCVSTLACTALLAVSTWSASAQTFDDDKEPPPRAGRISVIEGRMTYKNPDDHDWSDAQINYPVGPGQSFATAPSGRSEIELGGSVLRLDGRTTVTMLAMDDTATAARLEDGSLAVRVDMVFDHESIELETPDGRVTFMEPGNYHVDAGVGSAPTRVVAFSGRAEIETRRGRQVVQGGSAYEVNDAGQVRPASNEMTAIDDWSRSRDRVLASANTSSRYVGDGMPGYQDLDTNGAWQDTPDYGQVWYPGTVASDWAPYTTGEWIWVNPWGWSWVDAQPWGFAPFHYGRWVYFGGRWGWSPGERIRRPVFAPALVGFGVNDAWRFRSRNERPSHWVPLAPGEAFRPWYTRNDAYVRNVNRGGIGRAGITVNITAANADRRTFANTRAFDDSRARVGGATFNRGGANGNGPGGNAPGGRGNDPRWRNDGNRIVITDPPRTTPQTQQPAASAPAQNDNGGNGRQWSGRDLRRPGQGNTQTQIAPTLQTPNPVTQAPNPVTQAPQLNAPSAAAPGSDADRMRGRQRQSDPNASLPLMQPHLQDQSATTQLRRDRAMEQRQQQPNNGQDNLGQGNTGQNNIGQGNIGAPGPGGGGGDSNAQPPGGGGRGQGRGGFGRGRD